MKLEFAYVITNLAFLGLLSRIHAQSGGPTEWFSFVQRPEARTPFPLAWATVISPAAPSPRRDTMYSLARPTPWPRESIILGLSAEPISSAAQAYHTASLMTRRLLHNMTILAPPIHFWER